MDESQLQENNPNRYLILDTNILSRAGIQVDGKNTLALIIIEYLRDLLEKSPGWDIALSAVTIFELTDRASIEKEIINQQAIYGMKIFDVNLEILRCAGRLGSFYKEEGINDDQISAMDKMIAATAHLTGSVIYTIDCRDYPSPFFSEIVEIRKTFEYKNKDGLPIFITTYFMTPSVEMLTKYFEKRMLPVNEGKMQKHFNTSSVKDLIEKKLIPKQITKQNKKITSVKKREV